MEMTGGHRAILLRHFCENTPERCAALWSEYASDFHKKGAGLMAFSALEPANAEPPERGGVSERFCRDLGARMVFRVSRSTAN